jgi:hypothetical protein
MFSFPPIPSKIVDISMFRVPNPAADKIKASMIKATTVPLFLKRAIKLEPFDNTEFNQSAHM